MSSFNSIFILTNSKSIFPSLTPPPLNDPKLKPKSTYSVIRPSQNGLDLSLLELHLLLSKDKIVSTNFQLQSLSDMLVKSGDNLLDKLQRCYLDLSQEKRDTFLSENIYPGATEMEQFLNAFSAGVSAILLLSNIITNDCKNIIFKKICPVFPPCAEVDFSLINRNYCRYLSYYGHAQLLTCKKSLASNIFYQIRFFCDTFSECLIEGPMYSDEAAIYYSTLYLTSHIREYSERSSSRVSNLETLTRQGVAKINKSAIDIVSMLQSTTKETNVKLKNSQDQIDKTMKHIESLYTDACNNHVKRLHETGDSIFNSLIENQKVYKRRLETSHNEYMKSMKNIVDDCKGELTTHKEVCIKSVAINGQHNRDLLNNTFGEYKEHFKDFVNDMKDQVRDLKHKAEGEMSLVIDECNSKINISKNKVKAEIKSMAEKSNIGERKRICNLIDKLEEYFENKSKRDEKELEYLVENKVQHIIDNHLIEYVNDKIQDIIASRSNGECITDNTKISQYCSPDTETNQRYTEDSAYSYSDVTDNSETEQSDYQTD